MSGKAASAKTLDLAGAASGVGGAARLTACALTAL